MHIPEEEQLYRDFDWFCVDSEGFIGHFATAGFKMLPASVAKSRENLDLLMHYFAGVAPSRGGHIVDGDLVRHLPKGTSISERFLRSYVAMADKGLYSYDIESYLREDITYFRVALPMCPLHISELTIEMREVLGRTVLEMIRFRDVTEIAYAATLNA